MNNTTMYTRAPSHRVQLAGVLILLTALLVGGSYEAAGIIIRHDRDDARYREFYAEGDRFSAVGTIGGGMGTLIDPRWVVTAAHVVTDVQPFDPHVVIAGQQYSIERVIMHPEWRDVDEVRPISEVVDLALIRLRESVTDVEPVLLYENDDEVGREIIFVGNGQTGTGVTGPVDHDRKWRAATNTVEQARQNWLDFVFSEPPDATDLEGISGPGDSGGPALIERNGRLVILGVSSYNNSAGTGYCRYGSVEHYARISTTRQWIERTMEEYEVIANDVEPQFAPVIRFDEAGWPTTRVGTAAAAFIGALGDDEAMQRFSANYRSEQARENLSDKGYAAFWAEHAAGRGTPVKYIAYDENRVRVLICLTSAAGEETGWRDFQFNVEPDPPHYLGPTEMSTARPPNDGR